MGAVALRKGKEPGTASNPPWPTCSAYERPDDAITVTCVTQLPPDRNRPDVGHFEQGTPASRWALGRYLVGRAVGEYLSRGLLAFALMVIALAVLVWWVGPRWLAVLAGVFALCVLVLRWTLGAILRRATGAAYFAPMQDRLRRLVADTRGDVRAELRRIGVPSRTWTLPLLAWRLARRRRRAETLRRLRRFEVERVVPAARLDELHMIVQRVRPPGTGRFGGN
jgi:hypothetical protein